MKIIGRVLSLESQEVVKQSAGKFGRFVEMEVLCCSLREWTGHISAWAILIRALTSRIADGDAILVLDEAPCH